jgi:hypothetical protein
VIKHSSSSGSQGQCPLVAVRPEGANYLWRKIPPRAPRGGWPRIDRSLAIFRDFPPIGINDLEFDRDRVTLSDLKELDRAAEAAVAGDPVALAGCRADMGDPLAASAHINEMIASAIVLNIRCGERRGTPP